ncbi:hypothetical protein GV793_28650, partial [Nocardia cyriacigeorgica]|nr:hypothetical protein [Nocardia cyriacigeorgica]
LRATHTKGYVLGISGGQDSALAGRLCQLATEELQADGVDAAVAEFGEESGDRLRGVIGADHQQVLLSGDGVLDHHAF